MTTKNILYSFLGILTGIIVNQVGKEIYTRLNITDLRVKILGQTILCSMFLSYLQIYVSNKFAWEFQNATPGLFFTAFFFGVQYLSFTSIEDVYGIARL